MNSPTVSVLLSSYNHAPYVAAAIQSVLAQSFSDFELLIADDGSRDGTADVIAGITDSRIDFKANAKNEGAAPVTSELIARARGQYVAIINSDDRWLPGKLAFQVALLNENPQIAASFTRAHFIDHAGDGVPKDSIAFGTVFDQENRSRGAWLRRFFYSHNCLCHPSVLLRRQIYDVLGPYDGRYRQLPDFDMWIKVVKRWDIHVAEQALIEFRVLPGENASGSSIENNVRVMNEAFMNAKTFFDGVDAQTLSDGFSDVMRLNHPLSEVHLDIEKALLYFGDIPWLDHMYSIVGLSLLFDMLAQEEHRRVLKDDYGIDEKAFHQMMGQAGALRRG